jgi:hypothetical protein
MPLLKHRTYEKAGGFARSETLAFAGSEIVACGRLYIVPK